MPTDATMIARTMSMMMAVPTRYRRPTMMSGISRSPKPANRWLNVSSPPRSWALQPAISPAASTGDRTVEAMLPISGTIDARINMTMNAIVRPIHIHGAAAK
jgi:hypothetical protein